jgi:hypothetical protein
MPDQSLRVPAFCPVCSGLMKGRSTFTYYDYGCCIDCFIWFLEGRPKIIEKWKAGWKPSNDEMDYYREMMKN